MIVTLDSGLGFEFFDPCQNESFDTYWHIGKWESADEKVILNQVVTVFSIFCDSQSTSYVSDTQSKLCERIHDQVICFCFFLFFRDFRLHCKVFSKIFMNIIKKLKSFLAQSSGIWLPVTIMIFHLVEMVL